jgi:UDP-glucose 4-epimerase
MSILVIGGLGSIGSFVTRKLVEMGMKPVVYARHKNVMFIRDIEKKVIYARGDILNLDRLIQTIKTYKIQNIIHMAAMLSESETNPPIAVRMNVEGTANVLQAAVKCKVRRMVYASAKGVLSEATGKHVHPIYKPIKEDYPTEDCMGFYGLVKLFGEKLGLKYAKTYGLDFVALRFGTTWGPGKLAGHGPSPHTIRESILENAMLGKPTKHPQGAEQKDDIIYHKDTANGIVLACLTEGLTHRIFNLASGKGTTLLDFAAAVKKLYPKTEVQIGPGLDYLLKKYETYHIFDISRAKKELGFKPRYDLEKSVADYIEMMNLLGIKPTYTPT